MKTLIKSLDDVMLHEQGDFYILCGENKVGLEALFYNIMNNYCKQGGKCLCIKDNNVNPIDYFIGIENMLDSHSKVPITEYNITTINISRTELDISKLIDFAREKKYKFVFIKLAKKLITDDLIINIRNLCSDYNITVFLLPRIEINKTTNEDINTFLDWSFDVVCLDKQKVGSTETTARYIYYEISFENIDDENLGEIIMKRKEKQLKFNLFGCAILPN